VKKIIMITKHATLQIFPFQCFRSSTTFFQLRIIYLPLKSSAKANKRKAVSSSTQEPRYGNSDQFPLSTRYMTYVKRSVNSQQLFMIEKSLLGPFQTTISVHATGSSKLHLMMWSPVVIASPRTHRFENTSWVQQQLSFSVRYPAT
jgi:hypothetical protein